MTMETSKKKCRWCKHLSRKGTRFYCDVRNKTYAYKSVTHMAPESCGEYEESALDAISGRQASGRVENEARCFRCGAYIGNSFYDGEIYCEKCRSKARKEDCYRIRTNMNEEICYSLVNAIVENVFKEYTNVLYDIMECEKEKMKLGLLHQKRKLENYMFSKDFQTWNIDNVDVNRMISSIQDGIGYSEDEYGA